MVLKHAIVTLVILTVPISAKAQTVLVNQGGTGDFTTINAALANFSTDIDPAENVIQITDTAAYEEAITIETPVTIEATSSTRATLALLGNINGTGGNGGIYINLPDTISTGAVTLRNLNIMPATSTDNVEPKTAIENWNNNLFLHLDNCVLAPNNGQNQPLVSDAYTNDILKLIESNANYDPNVVQFADDGIVLGRSQGGQYEGGGVDLLLTDSVVTHFRYDYNVASNKPNGYGIWMIDEYPTTSSEFSTVFRRTELEGNSGVSFCWDALHVAGDLIVNGSKTQPIYVRGNNVYPIRLTGPAQTTRTLEGVRIVSNSQYGIRDDGYGSVRFSIKDSIVFFLTRNLLQVFKPDVGDASGTIDIERSTLVSGRNVGTYPHIIRFDSGTETNLNITDSIIAGRANNADGVIFVAGHNTVNVSGSAIVENGVYSMRTPSPFSLGAESPTLNILSSIDDDPQFLVFSENALDVGFLDVQNEAFATANSSGGPLGGGADYVGPTSLVGEWQLY